MWLSIITNDHQEYIRSPCVMQCIAYGAPCEDPIIIDIHFYWFDLNNYHQLLFISNNHTSPTIHSQQLYIPWLKVIKIFCFVHEITIKCSKSVLFWQRLRFFLYVYIFLILEHFLFKRNFYQCNEADFVRKS